MAMPSPSSLRIALCQINATVGDIAANEARIVAGLHGARTAGAQLVLFPELAVTGYPPEDLLLKDHFLRDARAALERIAEQTREIVAVVGFPEHSADAYNSAALLADGAVQAVQRKIYLPNYGVFDEQRYFQSGDAGGIFELGEHRVGITICEDIWEPGPPASDEALAGATLIVNVSASPYHAGKGLERERMVAQRARDGLAVYAYCALVGGQDELLFDGHSFVCDHTGSVIARAAQFVEELLVCEVDLDAPAAERLRSSGHRPAARRSPANVRTLARLELPPAIGAAPAPRIAPLLEPIEAEVYRALMLGLHDYVTKNGFAHVALGLSGGIDSALVACLAADALGPQRVSIAIMPSPYSSTGTQDDARELARRLGVEAIELPIAAAMEAYDDLLATAFDGQPADLTEENLQARIRGNLLMALSNKFGWLVLTTGNKSELSVGYSTLYGDLAGGFAVIKDVPKTLVYRLAEYRNHAQPAPHSVPSPIPNSVIERAPSAELRHGQLDQDSLPPYELLDEILYGYIEQDRGRDQLIAAGLPAAEVDRVIRLVDLAEYKRRQAPPGIKISARAFGRDRRMPITNAYGG
jgi:NAD+ synthase (glutamine-hydrolysing)